MFLFLLVYFFIRAVGWFFYAIAWLTIGCVIVLGWCILTVVSGVMWLWRETASHDTDIRKIRVRGRV